MLSVMLVVQDAITLGLRSITIYCDNQSVVSRSGKILKHNVTYQRFLSFLDEKSKLINIRLHKVKGHSTDKENNVIDKMVNAKRIDKILDYTFKSV